MPCISKVMCHGLFFVFSELIWLEVIVLFDDIGGIVDRHCLNFLFIFMCII
jgi:hypothetical protein